MVKLTDAEKGLFGTDARILFQGTDQTVYQLGGADGRAKMTRYGVFPGMNLTYNELCEELKALENQGRVFVLAPERPISVSRVEGNMEKLGALYWQGYTDAMNAAQALGTYLGAPV